VALLAKPAEERHQTAAGLEHDLRHCLEQWEAHGRVEAFSLGERDMPDRLVIPEKLYGREREVEALLAAFDRVVGGGQPELVLVSGYSGIGKSSLVNELHKALAPRHGLFASGKFDQLKRDIPYSTLAEAFGTLARQLLAKSDAELAMWREAFQEGLGPNGRLIVDLVPELKLVVGEPPPVPELEPQQAQSRFQLTMRRFVAVFARPEQPLALFLDDLQWLDAATLDLIEDVLTQADVRHLMLIGAYRDNEVDPAHPLARKLAAIHRSGAKVSEIRLAPLQLEHVGQLIVDTLRCEPVRAESLAQLVHARTGGNPFFAIQFLYAFADEGLLAFDPEAQQWNWDLQRIHAKGYADNVVDLMVGKLTRAPPATRRALEDLACLGNVVDNTSLAIALGASEGEIHAALWDAVRQELVERLRDSYRFMHDRVQEAAYALIPEGELAVAHLRIGRRLVAETPAEKREERIFEIVGQLNRAAALIVVQAEREDLAELNLIAGRRAKGSTAYASALTYLVAGAVLLPRVAWERCHDLAFALELNRAECEFLTGALMEAEARLAELSERAASPSETATVTRLRVDLLMTLGRSDRAVEVGLECLRRFDIAWPAHPANDEVREEYARLWRRLGDRPVESLIDLPPMTDPVARASIDVLTFLVTPALYTDENLRCLVIGRMGNLCLEHGDSDASCYAYAAVGNVLSLTFGDYAEGFRFAELGLDLVERPGMDRLRARVYLAFGNLAKPSLRHAWTGRPIARRAFEVALQVGDLTYAGYSCNNLLIQHLAIGAPLANVQREAEAGLDFARRARFDVVVGLITAQLGLIRTLRGLTPDFGCFSDDGFDERQFEQRLEEGPSLGGAVCMYWTRKLQAHVLAGDYAAAIAAAVKAERLLWMTPAIFERADYHTYAGLAQAELCETVSIVEGAQYRAAVAAHHRQLQAWAEHCPDNFESPAALIGAEIARLEGRELDAERLYEQAIRSARSNNRIHYEALANELAGRFYEARGFATISRAYLREARYGYARWGADGKVRQLDETHPQLREDVRTPSSMGTIGAPIEQLDLATVIKVSQAVSREIVVETLIDTLMRTAIEQAGAERGLLLLTSAGALEIAAEATIAGDSVTVLLRVQPISSDALPESALNTVQRTRESVILDDAGANSPFADDPYIRQRKARSILYLPLINQAKLIGVLYLENNLAPRVFAPGRIAVLKLIASQAAIALENTKLYRDLAEREATLREAQGQLAHANRLETMGQMTASIAHEVNQPIAATVTNAQAALRWLDGPAPDLNEAIQALVRIVRDGTRAGAVVQRIRNLTKKAPAREDRVDTNAAVREVIELSQSEAVKNGVSVRIELAEDLPLIQADRVQLQQVVVNLMVNGVEAMSGMSEGPRELCIATGKTESGEVLVAVRDSGPGLAPAVQENLFKAFHTTKPNGLGLGLSICRSIVESHGGRLWASANEPIGAVFQFTLPVHRDDASLG
jgi:predicted ATPase/signal transduction histidine kinase